jgi:hypothetical protein
MITILSETITTDEEGTVKSVWITTDDGKTVHYLPVGGLSPEIDILTQLAVRESELLAVAQRKQYTYDDLPFEVRSLQDTTDLKQRIEILESATEV